MTFAQDAFIYLDGCGSFNGLMHAAFLDLNANKTLTYAGWSASVLDDGAYKTVKFLFDRMLGANYPNIIYPPRESPPQRPFDIAAVWTDMESRNPPVNKVVDKDNPLRFATLRYVKGGSSKFGMFAPSIRVVSLDEQFGYFHLEGEFGSKQGLVKVNDVSIPVLSWFPTDVICTIPTTGPASAGGVVAEVDGRRSNAVPLTEWRGTLTLSLTSLGTLHQVYSFNLHFRADVHSFRDKPHTDPQPKESFDISPALDSKGTLTAGDEGIFREEIAGGCVWTSDETWTQLGSHDMVFVSVQNPQPNNGIVMLTRVNPADRNFEITFTPYANNALEVHPSIHIVRPPPARDTTIDYGRRTLSIGTDIFLNRPIWFKYDDIYTILPGEVDTLVEPVLYGIGSHDPSALPKTQVKLSWNLMVAHFPPSDTSGVHITPISIRGGDLLNTIHPNQ